MGRDQQWCQKCNGGSRVKYQRLRVHCTVRGGEYGYIYIYACVCVQALYCMWSIEGLCN